MASGELIKLREDVIALSNVIYHIVGNIDLRNLSIESRANTRAAIEEFGELISRMEREERTRVTK